MTEKEINELVVLITRRQKWFPPNWYTEKFNGDFYIFDEEKSKLKLKQLLETKYLVDKRGRKGIRGCSSC